MPKWIIITNNIRPPIPIREYDWRAHLDGEEEKMQYGYGETEAEAVLDLVTVMIEHGRFEGE